MKKVLATHLRYFRVSRGQLFALSILILSGLLYAGLTPFGPPLNEVVWGVRLQSIQFGKHGTILSAKPFYPTNTGAAKRSLEIWIKPAFREASGTILAFYDSNVSRGFSVHQSINDLEVALEPSTAWTAAKPIHLYAANGLGEGRGLFWSITSGPSGTDIYRDGTLLIRSSLLISGQEFSGRLIIANAPIFNNSWSGELRGLAVYGRELTSEQISRHYRTWTTLGRPVIAAEDTCVAQYLFDEGAGRVVHNKMDSSNDLLIPEKYLLVNPTMLDPVWRAFRWTRGFWEDALINFTGFVPAGFFWCAYFAAKRPARAVLASSILATTVSLLIELLQTQLPTRDSSMSDLITNSAGGMVGAILYRFSPPGQFIKWTERHGPQKA